MLLCLLTWILKHTWCKKKKKSLLFLALMTGSFINKTWIWMVSWEFPLSSLSRIALQVRLGACWCCLGPLPRPRQELAGGQGAFSPEQSTQKLFIFRKCQLTDRRCSKMPTARGSCCLQIGAVGAQVMTWINIRVGFPVAAKCLSSLQLGDSWTLTKMFLLILWWSAELEM